MNPLALLLIKELPDAIATAKALWVKAHPGTPEPTNEEAAAAYIAAFTSSLKKDDDWLAANPE